MAETIHGGTPLARLPDEAADPDAALGIYWTLEGHTPIRCGVMRWGKDRAAGLHEVARTEVGGATVSTVFLGLDHGFGMSDAPVLFETMVAPFPLNDYQRRCCTWDEAIEQHEATVRLARGPLEAPGVPLALPDPDGCVCEACGLDMQAPATLSCVAVPVAFPFGESLPQIPYSPDEADRRCHDCGVASGGLHHPGCDVEECPRCGCQAVACDCTGPEEEDDE